MILEIPDHIILSLAQEVSQRISAPAERPWLTRKEAAERLCCKPATVDKLATVAFNPHFSHLTHGPARRCPDHGFVTFRQGTRNEPRCLARQYCARSPREWTAPTAYDSSLAPRTYDEIPPYN